MSQQQQKMERFEYLLYIASEERELDDSEEMELRELESEFCVPFGGNRHE